MKTWPWPSCITKVSHHIWWSSFHSMAGQPLQSSTSALGQQHSRSMLEQLSLVRLCCLSQSKFLLCSRETLVNTMESQLLRCRLLELLFQHSCDVPTTSSMSLDKILYFLSHSSVLPQFQVSSTTSPLTCFPLRKLLTTKYYLLS